MITKAQMKQVISDNLEDIRIVSIQLFLEKLLVRTKFVTGTSQYRLTKKSDGTPITTIAEFEAAIDANSLIMRPMMNTEKMSGDRVRPFEVIIDNIVVTLDTTLYPEDEFWTRLFGNNSNRILFVVNYVSDADAVLPLKLLDMKLINEKLQQVF